MKNKLLSLFAIMLCCFAVLSAGCKRTSEANGGEGPDNDGPAETEAVNTNTAYADDTEQPQTPEPYTGKRYCEDYRASDWSQRGTSVFVETDDSYYMLSYLPDNKAETSSYTPTDLYLVYYTDKEYKDWMPLCSRPDCTHNNKNCNAYIDSENLMLYDKYLYFVDGTGDHQGNTYKIRLCRMELDGSAHETVCDLRELLTPELSFTPAYSSWHVDPTNKYIIITAAFAEQRGSDTIISHKYCYSFDLETMQYAAILQEYSGSSDFAGFTLFEGMGCYAYGEVTYYDGSPCKILEVDLSSGISREIGEFDGDIAFWERGIGIIDGMLCFCTIDDRSGSQDHGETRLLHLYGMDLETGETELVDEETAVTAKWVVLDKDAGCWYGFPSQPSDEGGFYVCDLSRSVTAFYPAAEYPEETGGNLYIGIITEDYIFARNDYDRAAPIWYLCKADIGTENLMWRKWEP